MIEDKKNTDARWSGGLYVHVPFCERKCVYCDFFSVESLEPIEEYLSALEEEIRLSADAVRGMHASTVYLGGGTPSLLSPAQLDRVLAGLCEQVPFEPGAEITLEVNPGTVNLQSLRDMRRLGFNRLSIGIQSFDDAELRFLGRIHTADDARRCISDARAAGFDNISLDLIVSLPGQDDERCETSLREAVSLEPQHISAYTLIVEDHTPLSQWVKAGQVKPNDEHREADLYEKTMAILDRAGYEHYEVSNYARPGFRSKHNSSYWTHTPYLGLGPSAHSFLWKEGGTTARRWSNVRSIGRYCDRVRKRERPLEREETLDAGQLFDEAVFLGLRSDGLDPMLLTRRWRKDLTERQQAVVRDICGEGWAVVEDGRIRLTARGFLLCDEICARLMVP